MLFLSLEPAGGGIPTQRLSFAIQPGIDARQGRSILFYTPVRLIAELLSGLLFQQRICLLPRETGIVAFQNRHQG